MSDDPGVRAVHASRVPAWHPAALVALMLLVSAVGTVLSSRGSELTAPHGPLVLRAYVPFLLVSWGLLLYVCRVGRRCFVFTELVAAGAYTPWRAFVDVALACGGAAVLIGAEVVWHSAFGGARNPAVEALLPSTPLERAVWCVVAVSAGISEEVVYRGYLVTELTRFTASRAGGVLGQALLFALAHGEQGASAMLRFFCYALGLGVLARARRSLVPGMLAHIGVDLLAGLSR